MRRLHVDLLPRLFVLQVVELLESLELTGTALLKLLKDSRCRVPTHEPHHNQRSTMNLGGQ